MFVVQNVNTNKYIKHDGSPEGTDFPYVYVDSQDAAEQYENFKHAEYVAVWYADMSQEWRIIDTETGETYVKSKGKFNKYVEER